MRHRDLHTKASVPLIFGALAALAGCVDEAPEEPLLDAGAAQPAADPPNTIWIKTPTGMERVSYVEVDGHAIMDGDIDLGPIDDVRRSIRSAPHRDFSRLWSEGRVHYCVASGFTSTQEAVITTQLDRIESVSPLRFIRHDTCGYPFDILVYQRGSKNDNSGSSDSIGFDGGDQYITLNTNSSDTLSSGLVVHETLHAVGFFHEQSRPDRGTWIDVFPDCTTDAYQYRSDTDARAEGMYDFTSIMHYNTGQFCIDTSPFMLPAECLLYWDSDGDGTRESSYCKTMTRKSGAPVTSGNGNSTASFMSAEDLNTVWKLYGDVIGPQEEYDEFGRSVLVRDFNRDGFADVAVGVPWQDVNGVANAGVVQVYRGTSSRLVYWQTLTEASVGVSRTDDLFGYTLAAYDVDKDGFQDLIIGNPYNDVPSGGSLVTDAGSVAVFRGAAAGLVGWRTYTEASMGGTVEQGDQFGYAVTAALIAGNGFDEATVAIGAPGDRNDDGVKTGAVYLRVRDSDPYTPSYWGYGQRLTPAGGAAGDRFGAALAVGNLGDGGTHDLVVGSPWARSGHGEARVYLGRTPSFGDLDMVKPPTVLTPPESGTREFGKSLAIGSVLSTSTSAQAIAIGAPGTDGDTGAVYLFSSTGSTFPLEQTIRQNGLQETDDQFGTALAIGNVDTQTNAAELIVGAPGENTNQGAISVFIRVASPTVHLEGTQLLQNDDIPSGTNAADRFGAALSAGNLNGPTSGSPAAGITSMSSDYQTVSANMVDDVIVGHPWEHGSSVIIDHFSWVGAVSVFAGSSGGLVGDRTYQEQGNP